MMSEPALPRRLLAEFLGTALLVAVVIGSGIAAAQLSPNDVGLQLLENSTTTAFGLAVLPDVRPDLRGTLQANCYRGGLAVGPPGRHRHHRRAWRRLLGGSGRRRDQRGSAGQSDVRPACWSCRSNTASARDTLLVRWWPPPV